MDTSGTNSNCSSPSGSGAKHNEKSADLATIAASSRSAPQFASQPSDDNPPNQSIKATSGNAFSKFKDISKQVSSATKSIDSFAKTNFNKWGSKLGVKRVDDTTSDASVGATTESPDPPCGDRNASVDRSSPKSNDARRDSNSETSAATVTDRRLSGSDSLNLKTFGDTISRAAQTTKQKINNIGNEIADEFHKIDDVFHKRTDKTHDPSIKKATGNQLSNHSPLATSGLDSSSPSRDVVSVQVPVQSLSPATISKRHHYLSDVLELDKEGAEDIPIYDPEPIEFVTKITSIDRLFDSSNTHAEVLHISEDGEVSCRSHSSELSQPSKSKSIGGIGGKPCTY